MSVSAVPSKKGRKKECTAWEIQWRLNRTFHAQQYWNCISVIDFLYELFERSSKRQVQPEVWESILENQLGLIHVRPLIFAQSGLFAAGYPIVAPTAQLIGIVAQAKDNPKLGIVAFRGTRTNAEWIKNLYFFRQTPFDFSKDVRPASSAQPGSATRLEGQVLFPSKYPALKEVRVASGFYRVYNSWRGVYKQDCACRTRCHERRPSALELPRSKMAWLHSSRDRRPSYTVCKPYADSDYAKIMKGSDCTNHRVIRDCPIGQHSGLGASIGIDVYDACRTLISQHGVRSFLFTGHSLGGALAQIALAHVGLTLGSHRVHSAYTFASPRVGNIAFRDTVNLLLLPKYNFRVANVEDVVTNVPLPYSYTVTYAHAGNTKHTFTNTESAKIKGILNLHLLKEYVQYLGSIIKNVSCTLPEFPNWFVPSS